MRGIRTSWVVAAVAVVVALVAVGAGVVERAALLPAANLDYSVTVADGVHPVTPNGQVAAIARHYLDTQDAESHVPSQVIAVTATFARAAPELEACVPAGPVAAAPDRVVWVVQGSGDFMNPRDLPWSSAGVPWPEGDLVIDDATGAVLGVYPHPPTWQSPGEGLDAC